MPHQTDDHLELYALGRLTDPVLADLEEHLLICGSCRDRLDETDAYVRAMRSAIADEPPSSSGHNWLKGLFSLRISRLFAPVYAGGFALLLLAAGFYFHSQNRALGVAAIELTAMRGDTQSVRAALETDITLSDTPAGSGSSEIVDAGGAMVWQEVWQEAGQEVWPKAAGGDFAGGSRKLRVRKQLAPGAYFVRLFDSQGKLLHEYGFRVL
jgi:hypothetical protein